MAFVLCTNHFINRDDLYHWSAADGRSRVCGVFEDKVAAKAEWKKLEHKVIRQRPLSQIMDFVEMPEHKLKQLDDWVQAHGSASIVDDYAAEQTIAEMSEDEVFEFVSKAHILSYQLLEWRNTESYFLAWHHKQQAYLTLDCDNELGSHLRPLIYTTQADQLLRDYVASFNSMAYGEIQQDESAFTLYGSLDELSAQPDELAKVIASRSDIRYDEKTKVLLLDYDVNVLQLVYPLLKQAPLQIEQVSLQRLCMIQAEYDAASMPSNEVLNLSQW